MLLLIPAPSRGLGLMMKYLREVEKKHKLAGNLCNIKAMGEGIGQARVQRESHGEALLHQPLHGEPLGCSHRTGQVVL